MVAFSLRALISHSIDYAGLFPPCSLALEPALKNQAEYVRSTEAWMLNSFVLPVGQFGPAKENLTQFDPNHPLAVSVLGPKIDRPATFLDDFADAIDAIRSFAASNVDLIAIKQLEMPLPAGADLELMKQVRSIVGNLTVFWEAPPDAAKAVIDLLAEHNYNESNSPFGYKLRTGGVTADAFPTSEKIARALVAPVKHQLPIKFTAGLHHPIRQYRDEVKAKMHGFLNVLGAAVLAAEHRWNEQQTAAMLDDENPASFSFNDEFFSWREWKIEAKRIEARRKFVASFGSCSFNEPRDDLRALRLL